MSKKVSNEPLKATKLSTVKQKKTGFRKRNLKKRKVSGVLRSFCNEELKEIVVSFLLSTVSNPVELQRTNVYRSALHDYENRDR